jgi:hypothetical protein
VVLNYRFKINDVKHNAFAIAIPARHETAELEHLAETGPVEPA